MSETINNYSAKFKIICYDSDKINKTQVNIQKLIKLEKPSDGIITSNI